MSQVGHQHARRKVGQFAAFGSKEITPIAVGDDGQRGRAGALRSWLVTGDTRPRKVR